MLMTETLTLVSEDSSASSARWEKMSKSWTDLPASKHQARVYSGPSYDHIKDLRQRHLSPALLTYYTNPIMLVLWLLYLTLLLLTLIMIIITVIIITTIIIIILIICTICMSVFSNWEKGGGKHAVCVWWQRQALLGRHWRDRAILLIIIFIFVIIIITTVILMTDKNDTRWQSVLDIVILA